jgi:uncharacterized protein YegJ (DUF2314 family)
MFGAVKKWWKTRKENSEVVSLVLLESTPKLLTLENLTLALQSIGTGMKTDLTEEKISYFRSSIEGFEITIASLPAPYAPLLNVKMREKRMTDVCASHIAFTMIDIWKAPDSAKRTEGRPLMAKIAAALTDEYVLAYFDWTSKKFCLADENIVKLLADGEIDEALNQVGDIVINVESDDERIEAAIVEAQERWPEFVEAFSQKKADAPFIAKARFEHNEMGEHLWMEVQSCDLESVTGKIANKPYNIPRPREGDVVTVPRRDISDWLMQGPEGPIGGFVERILTEG